MNFIPQKEGLGVSAILKEGGKSFHPLIRRGGGGAQTVLDP